MNRALCIIDSNVRPSNSKWGPGLTWFISNSGNGRAYFLQDFSLEEEQAIFSELTSKESVV